MRVLAFVTAALLLAAGPAFAADLTVTLRDAKGAPVRDAVVMYYPASGTPAPKVAGPYRVAQHNIQFEPFVTVVPVGAKVNFPNLDPVRHHVYSFSKGNKFELKLYGRDESRSITFDTAGVVALGCNIHDQMLAFIRVVDTPWAAKTDGAGVVVLHGAPAGAGSVKIWHPFLKGANNEIARPVSLAASGGAQTIAVELRPPPMHVHGY